MGTQASAPIPTIAAGDLNGSNLSNPIIGWLTEAVQESEAFLAAQPGFGMISKSIDAIMSMDETQALDSGNIISQTRTNRIAKISEDIAGLMTDIKPFWSYTINNRRFEQQAQVYGKLATSWYSRRSIDLRWAEAIKYHVAGGTGYIYLYYSPEIKDIDCRALDPRNVLPIRPVNYESMESCLGVIIKDKVPINYLKDRYDINVTADSDGSAITWLNKMRDSIADIASPVWKFRKSGNESPDLPRIPTATLYTCYLKDDRRSEKSSPMYMGEFTADNKPANNWSYIVEKGEKIYPNRRMIMWAGQKLIYDGPSFYWHGQFPVHKITLSPWPWTWLGKAPVWDLLRLQTSLNRLLRVVDDHASQVAQPGAVIDKNNVSRAEKDSLNTRRAGWKIYQNPLAGKGIQIIPPPPLDQVIFKHIDWIMNEMADLSGIADLRQLMNLNQMPSASTVEAIVNAMSPAMRFRSRIMEAYTRDFAMQLAYNLTQFVPMTERVAALGPGGITQEDYDFDPGTMLPDFVHDSDYGLSPDGQPMITPEAFERGPLPRYSRAKEFLRQFVFNIAPGSLLNAAQVEQKLIYLQLARAGWMDIFTLWEILGIPNIGVLPDNVRTIPQRLVYQQQMGLSGDVNAAGRKASGQEMPRVKMSESG